MYSPTADALWQAMPFDSRANTSGDEVYFATPVAQAREADARDLMALGDIAFWPDGHAIAICFGPTPISRPGEMRLASASNVWASALGDPKMLRAVRDGDTVTVERLNGDA